MAETKAVKTDSLTTHDIVCAECEKFWKTEAHDWDDGVCTVCGFETPFGNDTVEPEHKCMAETKAVKTDSLTTHDIVCAECEKFWKTEAHDWDDGVCTVCGFETPFSPAPEKPVEPKHPGCLKPETCTGERLLETEKNGKLEVVWACGKLTFEDLPEEDCKHENTHDDIFEASCSKEGTKKVVCDDCGETVSEEVLPVNDNHAFHNGKCLLCGKEEVCEHDYKVVKEQAADCLYPAYVWKVCTKCGAEKNHEVGEPTGEHNYVVVKELAPTCVEAGYVWMECSVCGAEKNHEVGEATGEHEYVDGKCEMCGAAAPSVPSTPLVPAQCKHFWNKGWVTKEATCEQEGEKVYFCFKCHETKTETIAKKAHDIVIWNKKEAASCSDWGYTGDKCCASCWKIIEKGEVVKGAHDIYVWQAKEATCTENGYTGDKCCTICWKVIEKGEVIPKKAHDIVLWNAKEATTEEAGYTGDKCCASCWSIIEKGEVIPKKESVPATPLYPAFPNWNNNPWGNAWGNWGYWGK